MIIYLAYYSRPVAFLTSPDKLYVVMLRDALVFVDSPSVRMIRQMYRKLRHPSFLI